MSCLCLFGRDRAKPHRQDFTSFSKTMNCERTEINILTSSVRNKSSQHLEITSDRFIFHPRWISRLNRAARTQRTTGSMCQTKTENLEHSTNNRSINISRLKTKCWIHKISSSVKEIKTILTNIVKIPESKISLHPLCFCRRLLLIYIITPLYYNYLTISCCQSNI